ncbi:uncharacterized protein LOC144496150 [Mustelus asterias]
MIIHQKWKCGTEPNALVQAAAYENMAQSQMVMTEGLQSLQETQWDSAKTPRATAAALENVAQSQRVMDEGLQSIVQSQGALAATIDRWPPTQVAIAEGSTTMGRTQDGSPGLAGPGDAGASGAHCRSTTVPWSDPGAHRKPKGGGRARAHAGAFQPGDCDCGYTFCLPPS